MPLATIKKKGAVKARYRRLEVVKYEILNP